MSDGKTVLVLEFTIESTDRDAAGDFIRDMLDAATKLRRGAGYRRVMVSSSTDDISADSTDARAALNPKEPA